jgi:predicted alpha/beta superfamily hydrolase
MKIKAVLIMFWIVQTTYCFATMTIQIVSTPHLTPILDTLYIAGTFNNWQENDPMYMCHPDANGWSVEISAQEASILEFKFTRGSWSRVEGDAMGNYIANRSAPMIYGTTLEVAITGWEDLPGAHTVASNVKILDSNFWMPQLNRSRRIWIQLPDNFENNNQTYPVWYMMDGQNTMDLASSFAGEWQIDESILAMQPLSCQEAIIIGIDNGGTHRIDEYSPWINSTYNEGGEGAAFVDFLVETLKPYIDASYPTLTDAEHTCIAGSSLGALIATYAMCRHPNVFGRGGMFSPAYWFNPEIFAYASSHPLSATARIYFVAGTNESDDMVPDMTAMESTIQSAGIVSPTTYLITHADGAHSEWYWRREFPAAYTWLTQCDQTDISEANPARFTVYPNPVNDTIYVEFPNNFAGQLLIMDTSGRILHTHSPLGSMTLSLSSYPKGAYSVVILDQEKNKRHTRTILKQ